MHMSRVSRALVTPSLNSLQIRTKSTRLMSTYRRRPALPVADEIALLLSDRPSSSKVVDTHTHIALTYEMYRKHYRDGRYRNMHDFVRGMYGGRQVEAVVDVWCEAPVRKEWKEYADSALTSEDRTRLWGGTEYWFVMGVHPHSSKSYNDRVENDIINAMTHPRCVGWGEVGLDYHYDHSPRDIQQRVFARQLQLAVKLGKPITIHTREADEDTERILKENVPSDHKIHLHCFTDSPDFAGRLLEHFPNLYVGITGVITYSSNRNTSKVVHDMTAPSSTQTFRILLETDAPFMTPSNLPKASGKRPLCHSAMIPWTADFVAKRAMAHSSWDADDVMEHARRNAKFVYGI